MAEIDYEAAWQALKAEVCGKPSHGQRDLLASMARLEVENNVTAGLASSPTRSTQSPPAPASLGRRRAGAVHA